MHNGDVGGFPRIRVLDLIELYAPGEPSYLNVAVADGRSAVACRITTDSPGNADSLYLSQGRRYVCEDNVCRMLEADEAGGAVLISSERLSDDSGWPPISVGEIVIVQSGLQLDVRPART